MSFQADAFQNDAFQVDGINPPASIIGGHFLPGNGKRKHSLSNVLTIYNKAKELPRQETKELRDAISEFVEPAISLKTIIPDIVEVDYQAIEANEKAYAKFSQAIANIQARINEIEQNKIALSIKQQEEDDELLLITIMSCIIH